MHVMKIVARFDALLGVLLPELQDLVLLGALDELVGLLLVLFSQVVLPPIPKKLSFDHLPDFSRVLSQ